MPAINKTLYSFNYFGCMTILARNSNSFALPAQKRKGLYVFFVIKNNRKESLPQVYYYIKVKPVYKRSF